MKKTVMREVACCDECGKEEALYTCRGCRKDFCYECWKDFGKTYQHGVSYSGSGDGYYCEKCDAVLTRDGTDPVHNAYRAVQSLRFEAKVWEQQFEQRKVEAEKHLQQLTGN